MLIDSRSIPAIKFVEIQRDEIRYSWPRHRPRAAAWATNSRHRQPYAGALYDAIAKALRQLRTDLRLRKRITSILCGGYRIMSKQTRRHSAKILGENEKIKQISTERNHQNILILGHSAAQPLAPRNGALKVPLSTSDHGETVSASSHCSRSSPHSALRRTGRTSFRNGWAPPLNTSAAPQLRQMPVLTRRLSMPTSRFLGISLTEPLRSSGARYSPRSLRQHRPARTPAASAPAHTFRRRSTRRSRALNERHQKPHEIIPAISPPRFRRECGLLAINANPDAHSGGTTWRCGAR